MVSSNQEGIHWNDSCDRPALVLEITNTSECNLLNCHPAKTFLRRLHISVGLVGGLV